MESVNAIVAFAQKRIEAGLPAPQPKENRKKEACPSFRMPLDDCPPLPGKVTWQPSVTSWAYHAKDKKGKIAVKRVRLRTRSWTDPAGIDPRDFEGNPDSRKAWVLERRRRYLEAIALWNEQDESTRDRILVPSE